MSEVLARWNRLSPEEAAQEISTCCGSAAWAGAMAAKRPFEGEIDLVAASDEIWNHLTTADWLEAFSKHPRIGERKAPQTVSARSAAWSGQEQQRVAGAAHELQVALLEGNRDYEQKFGRVFIVCATGKSAPEILEILRRRLGNDEMTELREAAEEQRKITNLRLKKWFWG
jgi:2-oxo-4-hydroxy-4-carboxy-5-ureidoimidazoline decarboxylase